MNRSIFLAAILLACGGSKDDTDAPVTDTETDTDTDTDTDSDTDTDTDSDTDTDASVFCPALEDPTGNVIDVTTDDVGGLQAILDGAVAGDTISLAAGTYDLNGEDLWFRTDGVTFRGATGNRDEVILDGNYVSGSILNVGASDVTIADLQVTRSYYHPIHVSPSNGRNITGVLVYNVHLLDPGEQALKINTGGNFTHFADNGEVSCSHLELTDTGRPEIRNSCYTGGVDMHQGRDWVFRDNLVEGFWCENGISEHGIHLWRGTRGALIERNLIRECARGIGLGLGNDNIGRDYADSPCGGQKAQDYESTVRNNWIYVHDDDVFDSQYGMDVGIGLESACDATVVHNTIYSDDVPFASIDYRFDLTTGILANNLVSHLMRRRDNAPIAVSSNHENAGDVMFAHAPSGDLHLAPLATDAIDLGDPAYAVAEDMDGDTRDATPDIGADELNLE